MKRVLWVGAIGLAAMLSLAGCNSTADGHVSPASKIEGQNCINLQLIDHPIVINDFGLVYRMRGGRLYLTTFPRRCSGLTRQRAFTTELTTPYRLCRGDQITVSLTHSSCRLGAFNPISADELKRLQYAAYLDRKAKENKANENKSNGK